MRPVTIAESEFEISGEWRRLLEELATVDGRRCVYLLGATDQGKTTLCRYLLAGLRGSRRCAIIDCDTGQSTIGPPATLGLALFDTGKEEPVSILLRFAEDTSPRGHFMPFLAGARRLLDRAFVAGAELVLVDSPGYVDEEAAVEFQVHMIDLLAPDLIVAIQKERELEPILGCFNGDPVSRILRLAPSPKARTRTQTERRAFREGAFREYFAFAAERELCLEGRSIRGRLPPSFRGEDWHGLLIALCDRGRFVIALGVVLGLEMERRALLLFAPPFDEHGVTSIHVGTTRLKPEWLRKTSGEEPMG